ncbi:MAG: ectoine hydroxylase-related dioxygenase (phytanoyl-CoA dioxygenase family) [Saprospiraceae bacterium]|jgi:ectoine hydroxylase-related dioxygenase (phytanoyl-CoA dioxygenase family)
MAEKEFHEIQCFRLNQDDVLPVEAVTALNQDGVVCVRDAINQYWRSRIEVGIKQALNGASTNVDIVEPKNKGEGAFSFSSGAWRDVADFRDYIFDSPLADIAHTLLETNSLILFYDFLLIKEARSASAATPWHQDHSYYPIDGYKVVNSWVALDDIPLESALRFIQGSHQDGMLYRGVDFADPAKDYRHARKQLPLPPSNDTEVPSNILCSAMNAGDMLVWKSYTFHSAPGNQLDRRRAAFSINWLGDDVVFNGEPSLETYKDPSQVVGQPITCDKFPLVRGH